MIIIGSAIWVAIWLAWAIYWSRQWNTRRRINVRMAAIREERERADREWECTASEVHQRAILGAYATMRPRPSDEGR